MRANRPAGPKADGQFAVDVRAFRPGLALARSRLVALLLFRTADEKRRWATKPNISWFEIGNLGKLCG